MRRTTPDAFQGTVLVADEGNANGRTALGTVRALAAAGYSPWVTVADRPTLASSSRWSAGIVGVSNDSLEVWTRDVTDACRRLGTSLVVPASDSAVIALGVPGADLVDKRVVRARAAAAGLRVPEEQHFANLARLERQAETLPYPVVVKCAVRSGLHPFEPVKVSDRSGLAQVPANQPLVVQPFLPGTMSAIAGVVVSGRLVAAVHQRYLRIWPSECGVGSAAVTSEPDLDLENRVLQLMDGHEGIFQVQFVDGHVIDVNPRAYGSMPLALRAGVNLPDVWLTAGKQRGAGSPLRGRPGVRYRWVDADLRAVREEVRSGRMSGSAALIALAPRFGTAHSIESRRDPRPFLLRLTQVL